MLQWQQKKTTEPATATERTAGDTTITDLPTRNIVTTNALNCDNKNVEAEGKYTWTIW